MPEALGQCTRVPAPSISPGFICRGPSLPRSPVILAVPHAGREYPSALTADCIGGLDRLLPLEDRYADLLVEEAVAEGTTAIIASRARAWLDLNRDPREIDRAMINGPAPANVIVTNRTRNGLGLIPRRIGNGGEYWRRRLSIPEIEERVASDHAPYHAKLAETLEAARTRFGIAILLDCHSMPPLRNSSSSTPAALVVGDRFGRSASALLSDTIEAVIHRHGFLPARNVPYAGGYSLDRHGRPGRNIHALQIEVDRSLYLDRALHKPGPGLARMQALLARIVAALVAETGFRSEAIAAE